jgi:hypothetical protein
MKYGNEEGQIATSQMLGGSLVTTKSSETEYKKQWYYIFEIF